VSFPDTHPALSRALAEREYTTPTPVQSAVIEPEAEGRDLLVSAQTGSGKTIAFGLAMAETLLEGAAAFGPARDPLALIIAPTRELALQVQRELGWLYHYAGARIVSGAAPNGEVELKPRETKTVTLIPQAGTYQAHCSHFMHATMGMHTQVVVR